MMESFDQQSTTSPAFRSDRLSTFRTILIVLSVAIAGSIVGVLLYKKHHQPQRIIDGLKTLQNLEAGSKPVTTTLEERGARLQVLGTTSSTAHTPSSSAPTKTAGSSGKAVSPQKAAPALTPDQQMQALDRLNNS